VTKQRAFAALGVVAAAYGLFRATRLAENAAKDVKRRGWRADVGLSVLVALAALVLALKKSRDAVIEVDHAFGAEATAG
jgi:hypothetical protein